MVYLTFDGAQEFCKWSGKRLPTDKQWKMAAYDELKVLPTHGFKRGKRYPFPTGQRSTGANCLDDCGENLARDRSTKLNRGKGHALAGTTRQGVNGLYDRGPMYGNGLISPIDCIQELLEVLGGMGRPR